MLPLNGPKVFAELVEDAITDKIDVSGDMRRVARALEADRRVSDLRVPSLVRELYNSLRLMSARREERQCVLNHNGTHRNSITGDVIVIDKSRSQIIRDDDTRELAGCLSDKMDERMSHLYLPVRQQDIRRILDNDDEVFKKQWRAVSQSILLHAAASISLNECPLDWLPKHKDVRQYKSLITDIVRKFPNLLGDEVEEEENMRPNFGLCERK